MKKAFTLIELLVVVLIIGLLAAIALPQYQKAVEKSKSAQALTMLRSASQAAVAHYMATGEYPTSFADMGFEVPWTGTTKWSQQPGAKDTKSNAEWSLQIYRAENGGLNIYVGRISGKYAGAGFTVNIVNSERQLGKLDIRCGERTSSGLMFSTDLAAGDYCVKIMNGTLLNDPATTTYRTYSL